MFAGCEFRRQQNGGHGAAFKPFTLVDSHSHGSVDIYASLVLQINCDALETVPKFFFGKTAADGSGTVA